MTYWLTLTHSYTCETYLYICTDRERGGEREGEKERERGREREAETEREREREREREGGREGGRERGRERERERERERGGGERETARTYTKKVHLPLSLFT
jgi:hypothetical protein